MIAQMLHQGADGVLEPHPLGLVDEDNDTYHAGPGISKSHLDVMRESPLHYWAKYIDPDRVHEESTPSQMLGSAIHSAILEPDLFPTEFIESPEFNLRTNAGRSEFKAFKESYPGKVILKPDERTLCLAVRDAVYRHPAAAALRADTVVEQSFYAIDPETGELVKCRVDALKRDGSMIVDVKTTENSAPRAFGYSAHDYRYPLQTAWYNDVLDAALGDHPPTWVFLAVEKKWPHPVGIYYVEPEQLPYYRQQGREDFLRILQCRQERHWPDHGCTPMPLLLPKWVTSE